MQFFMGGERVVGTLNAYSTGMSLRQWREIRDTAMGNTRRTASWVREGRGQPTDGFVSFESLQAEIMDIWKRGVVNESLPHPNSWRARLNRFWLWVTMRAEA